MKMFEYDFSDRLRHKFSKIAKKDKVLGLNLKKKIKEVISNDLVSIDRYKNLRSPLNEYKRIHLTGEFILLFIVDKENRHITFMDVTHWDNAYKSRE